MARSAGKTTRSWTTVARAAVCVMLAGGAADLAGWRVGAYVAADGFFGLMLSLYYP
jgi:hypothetical protein